MKIKFSLLFLAFALFSISCGDDTNSENETETETGLEGTWKAESFSGSASSSFSIAGETISTLTSFEGEELDYTLEFSETTFDTEGSYDLTVAITVSGETNTSEQSYDNVDGTGSYTTSNDTIMVEGQLFELDIDGAPTGASGGDSFATYTIVGNTLTVTQNETTTDNGSGLNVSVMSQSIWTKQ